MTTGQNKIKKQMAIIFFSHLIAIIAFGGCSSENIAKAKISQQFFTTRLNQQPDYQPILTGKPSTCGMRAGRVYLKPGEDCGSHSTNNNEEMLTFLSGNGTALIGEEQVAHAVGKDSIIYIPPYTIHNMRNTGTEPLIYIYCVAPVNGETQKAFVEKNHCH